MPIRCVVPSDNPVIRLQEHVCGNPIWRSGTLRQITESVLKVNKHVILESDERI